MTNPTSQPSAKALIATRSTILSKLTPQDRMALDLAIVDQSATYRELYQTFELQSKGVSLSAFYYYARRTRMQNHIMELARLSNPDGVNLASQLPDILCCRLVELAVEEEICAPTIHRLAQAYRVTHVVRTQIEEAQEKETQSAQWKAQCLKDMQAIAKQASFQLP